MPKGYLQTLKDRAKTSKVYRRFQLDGLEISQILSDEKHKSLYIKLAKQYEPQALRRIAKEIAENPNVRSKGAYFMTRLKDLRPAKDTRKNG